MEFVTRRPIAQKFKGEDINFEAHPEFSRMFQLKGRDEAAIRDLLSDDVIRHLENCKNLRIETCRNRIIFYKKRHRCSVKKVETFIKDTLATYAVLVNLENK